MSQYIYVETESLNRLDHSLINKIIYGLDQGNNTRNVISEVYASFVL